MFSKSMVVKGAVAAKLVKADGVVHVFILAAPNDFLITTQDGEHLKVKAEQTVVAGTVNYGVRKVA
jgi:type V secretory pathway adhesin AidA